MIDKTRFGEKHVCPKCKIKFYDMNRRPVICPNCGYNLEAPEEKVVKEEIIDDIPPIDTGEEDEIVTMEEVEETFGGDTIITTEIAEEDLDSDFDDT